MLTVPGATQPAALFIKHPLETSLSLSLLDIIMSSLISNGIFIGPLLSPLPQPSYAGLQL